MAIYVVLAIPSSFVGFVGLTYLIVRNFPQVTRALLVGLAAIVAMFARDEDRRERGLNVLGKLTAQDSGLSDDDNGKDLPSPPKP